MKLYRVLILILIVSLLGLLQGCSDGPERPRTSSGTGTVYAFVIDGSVGPVPDVEIRLLPTNLVATTDENGRVVFHVPPGDYFVDANVCCIGPGTIDYHLPVTVRAGRSVEVRLVACLICV